jgi:RHS repeat-associated protein
LTYKFTGKERDSESGLDNFGARYASSSMGRFMSPDWSESPEAVPYGILSNPQTLNLYAYVKNNPGKDTDPTGHSGDDDIVDHILNFALSAGATFLSDNFFGTFRPSPKSPEGTFGQAVGDFAAQQSGIAEAEAGAAGLASAPETAAVPEVGPGGAALQVVVSEAGVLHGTTTAAIATINLAKSATVPGSRPGQDFTPAGKREIDARDGDKCQNCGRDVKSQQNKSGEPTPPDQRQRHHKTPKKEGGSGTPENGETLCPGCHKEKHSKPPNELGPG